jgi:hypothetical protein
MCVRRRKGARNAKYKKSKKDTLFIPAFPEALFILQRFHHFAKIAP